MHSKPERITSTAALVVLGSLAVAGALVAIVGLATSSPGDDGARRAYVAGLAAAVLAALMLASLLSGRRRALVSARVRAGDLERRIELVAKGRGDADDPQLRADADALVAVLLRAGSYEDAERLALAVKRLHEPPPPVRLEAATA
jgi:type VI protein secretion system component VasK